MNKIKVNNTSFFIVVLVASFIAVIYLNIESLADDHSIHANFRDTGIHFHGEIMRYASSCASYPNQDVDFPNSDLSQNYYSPLFNKRLLFSAPLQQSSIRFTTSYATNSTYQKNHIQLHSTLSLTNLINTGTQNNRQNTNNSFVLSGFNPQAFTSNLFPGKRMQRHSITYFRDDTTKQHLEFHVLNSFPVSNTNISYVNYSGVQDDIIDPGDQPDGDEIPVPNGTYFLLFLSAIYACWKIKNVRE
jgi:hypothetical protein